MKKQIYTFIALLIILTISSVTASQAQSVTTAKAHIPFEFGVRNQTIAAGDSVIKRLDNRPSVWSLQSADNRQSVILLAMSVESTRNSDNNKMTFRRYGNKYFLAGIETSGNKIEFQKSRAERRLERELKFNRIAKIHNQSAKPEIVAVKMVM